MMSNNVQGMQRQLSAGDTAVDGLIAGMLSGLAMGAFLVLAGLVTGVPPAAMMGRFDPGQGANWLAGSLAHLAVSGIYGVVFALLFVTVLRMRPSLRKYGWLAGLVYGLFLYAVARGLIFRALPSNMLQIAPLLLLVGHIIYGLLLGVLVQRGW